ncbi:sugar phosphate isomerase/epimerase [Paenibacillus sp. LHD-117]|uniref:sugar phosphate isomerase/epimerase family protein n=1 Tax=Paenibacillus sp. LHD-117 TaxID=3071412 RepID=UPI0027E1F05E|nr:TIM barrel protein [Paenibacillus sp. LHD-117]MDQ6420633.1 sugar phosphate isomerase/epimerase [Paenibacillus sp. LHD-117]
MKLLTHLAFWGVEGTLLDNMEAAKSAGHNGIETGVPSEADGEAFKETLDRLELTYVAQIFTSGDHLASFEEQVKRAAAYRPVLINAHSAKDSMTEAEQDAFYEGALRIEQQYGVPIGHETHRGRAMFTPWATSRLLKKFPELRITADFSHWVNVCESHLTDQEENVALAIDRTIHVHGRIGFPEGPQVPHPASPFFKGELELFTGWWKRIMERQAKEGRDFATFTAEFGPPGYMPTEPFTNAPIADLMEVNAWTTRHMREQFAGWKLG